MGPRTRQVVSQLGIALAAVGCEQVLDIEPIEYVAGPSAGCRAPDGDAAFRMANLVPAATSVDLCLRKPGDAWKDAEPALDAAGTDCEPGVAFRQLTVPFGTDPGTYDVKFVEEGEPCTADGPSIDDVELEDDQTTSVILFGPSFEQATAKALVDSPAELGLIKVRFVHALEGVETLDAGVMDEKTLPAKFLSRVFVDVPFAGVAEPLDGTLPVREHGYMQVGRGDVPLANFPLGAAPAGKEEALLVLPTDFEGGGAYSLFALGEVGSVDSPPALLSCDETRGDGIWAECGDPMDLTVDVYNPLLTDLFTPMVEERADPVAQAVMAADGDLVCLTEVYPPTVSAGLVEALRGAYPVAIDSNTLGPANAADEAGLSGPFCPGELEIELEGFLECLASSPCVEERDGETHLAVRGLDAINCIAEQCGEHFFGLVPTGWDADSVATKRCWMCSIVHLSGYQPLQGVRELCTTGEQPFFAFEGSTGLVVLSKYDVGKPELELLPSTGWQRAALRVPVQLDNGASFDFYCADLTYPHPDPYLPYVGPYGDGEFGIAGAEAEQVLQVEQLSRWVTARSTDRGVRSILAGVLYSGPEVTLQDEVLVRAEHEQAYELMTESFALLVVPGYQASCTWCVDNPWLSDAEMPSEIGVWSTHILGRGFRPEDVRQTVPTFTEPVLEVGSGQALPLSPHYGLRSVLKVTH